MAYFRPSIDAGGIHIPVYDDILGHLIDQYKIIFGEDVYLGNDSKDYQMLAVFAKALDDFGALAVGVYNARSPLFATGDSLDVLCTIVGITRRSAEKAEADVQLSGIPGTIIEAGCQFSDINGELWDLQAECILSSNGTATGHAVKEEPGKVSLVSGYINSVYSTIVGLESVQNTTIGYAGKDTESDDELRLRMRLSLLSRAATVDIAIESAISQLEGVTGVKVYINDSYNTDSHGIPSHTICPVVYGGDDDEIAKTFFNAKAPGIGTYGDVTKTVTDAYGRQKLVSFKRPVIKPFSVAIEGTVYNSQVDLSVMKQQIKDSIFEWGNNRAIGENLIVSRIYPEIYSAIQTTGVAITSVTVSGDFGEESSMAVADWDWLFAISSADDINTDGIVYG